VVKTKAQHRRHGQSRPIAMGATRLALGDSSLSKMRNIGTMARAAKKNPAPRGYEARGPHVAGCSRQPRRANSSSFKAWQLNEKRPPEGASK
jgi:hypothetical protein